MGHFAVAGSSFLTQQADEIFWLDILTPAGFDWTMHLIRFRCNSCWTIPLFYFHGAQSTSAGRVLREHNIGWSSRSRLFLRESKWQNSRGSLGESCQQVEDTSCSSSCSQRAAPCAETSHRRGSKEITAHASAAKGGGDKKPAWTEEEGMTDWGALHFLCDWLFDWLLRRRGVSTGWGQFHHRYNVTLVRVASSKVTHAVMRS